MTEYSRYVALLRRLEYSGHSLSSRRPLATNIVGLIELSRDLDDRGLEIEQ